MTVIALNISEPKTSVHLTPSISLDGVREIQVIDFARVRKPFVRLTKQQKVYNLTGGDHVELFGFNRGVFTIEDLQQAFTRVNKGINILKSDGDWLIVSKINVKLGKEFYTELGVPEILTAGKPYPLVWNCQRFFVYCDIVDKHESYGNTSGGSLLISNPSKILAVVPSQHYPTLRIKSHQRSYLNDFNLSITNIDGSVPTFGMNSFIITLKLT